MVKGEVRLALLMVGVSLVKYAGHNLHIGAASTAALCGIKDSTIKTLGQQNSEAYMHYFKLTGAGLAYYSQVASEGQATGFNDVVQYHGYRQ